MQCLCKLELVIFSCCIQHIDVKYVKTKRRISFGALIIFLGGNGDLSPFFYARSLQTQ